MSSFKYLSLFLLLSLASFLSQPAVAQESSTEPIYLKEPEPEPPARPSKPQKIKEVYEDQSTRVERVVVKMSDDRIVNHGKFVEFYKGGQKYVEGNYKMGVFEGQWSYWFPNGQICKTLTFKDGKANGQWEIFNNKGELTAKRGYKNGKRDGKWVYYHEGTEQPRLELGYDQGIAVGDRTYFFENGQKRQSVPFKAGKMNGMLIEWNEAGQKIAEALFEDGKLSGEIKRFKPE